MSLGASVPRCVAIAAVIALASTADAQTSIRATAAVGATAFAASQSFEAVLGSGTGVVYGGGVEMRLPYRLYAGVQVTRFRAQGERVFVFGGETFPLGIPTTVTIMPVEVTAGYRFVNPRTRFTPYVGGGAGLYRHAEDDVSERHRSLHVLGGTEFRIARWLHVAGEAQWTTVPDALGQDPNSVSAEFGESDLGGTTFRIKIVIGR